MQSPKLSTLYLNPTSLTEIKKLTSNLQPKKSTGIDEIPPTTGCPKKMYTHFK